MGERSTVLSRACTVRLEYGDPGDGVIARVSEWPDSVASAASAEAAIELVQHVYADWSSSELRRLAPQASLVDLP